MDTNNAANVLFVDDDEQIRHLVTAILRHEGFQVTIATKATDALKYLETATPDIIVSDVMMPDMDGFTFLKNLRSQPASSKIPVILLTALVKSDDVVTGLSLGADDYIRKPFMPSELVARIRSKLERPPIPSEQIIKDIKTGLPKPAMFGEMVGKELFRSKSKGSEGYLAYLALSELNILSDRLGTGVEPEVWKQTTKIVETSLRPLDVVGWGEDGYLGFILPETSETEARSLLSTMARDIMNHRFTIGNERLRMTPSFGYASFRTPQNTDELNDRVLTALDQATQNLDLQPLRYDPKMGSLAQLKKTAKSSSSKQWFTRMRETFTLPGQILLTLLIGAVLPYFVYTWFDSIGRDISSVAYLVITAALVITASLIWIEGFLATKAIDPPIYPKTPYPPASAIIAAYLPNEAPTILETVEAFLQIEYPAPLQIILAYNTPHDLPVEFSLRRIAEQDPRFKLLRVTLSSSKAQNVNKALTEVTGKFVGVFDADHQPARDSFTRAWRWLSHGSDVVQGHCVVRNGDVSWISRLVAVEFEAIYAVSHPGRAILHKFGIFGGSNGFWRTDLLRKTRMHGSMLTEDIDSSIRVMTAGAKIVSDPKLISRELAPTSLKALWNQRLRWAQGWLQVSMKHLLKALNSDNLTRRQKFGLLWLLGWREIYPWISMQMFPIILFWIVKYGGVDKINWLIPIFVMSTLFTLSVAPGQAYFAYKLSDPEIRKNKKWFTYYLIVGSIFYVEFKNIIARVAQMKELFRERHWKVTPRTVPNKV
jgi:cellulose synthase/poly-beta-1,6-N-acetylglucosamine synthase-like glycosyltransferase/DNA-binding NarL/FixJ family response regulator